MTTKESKLLFTNKTLAIWRLSYACHRLPGMRWIGRQISPVSYFKWAAPAARASSCLYPADRRRIRYMRRALDGKYHDGALRNITRKNIVYRQWLKTLTHGWPSWADRHSEWTRIDGERHLQAALGQGKGAVLFSGHSFGFNSLVAPILSQREYRLHRTGRGHWGDPAGRWGRDWSLENWHYNSYGQDFWQHVRALNKMRQATAKNEIVHLLVTGFPAGEAELEIAFCHNRFFLDPVALRIVESLKAPVLPCFCVCDKDGRLHIELHPPLAPSRAEIMREFGPLYARYLREKPEFAFFWRKVVQQKGGW